MSKSDVLFYRKGTLVFDEGDSSRDVYVIKSGKFEVFKVIGGKAISIAIVEPGAILGEMAFIDNKPRSAGIRAYEDGYLIRISEDQLRREVASMPKWLGSLFRVLSSRVRSTSEDLAKSSFNNWVAMAKTLEVDFPKNLTFRFTDYERNKVFVLCDSPNIDMEDALDLKAIVSTYLTIGRKEFYIDLSPLLSIDFFSCGLVYSMVMAIEQCGGRVRLAARQGIFSRHVDVFDTTELEKHCLYDESASDAMVRMLNDDNLGINERFSSVKTCGYCSHDNDAKFRYCVRCGSSFVGDTANMLFSKIKKRVKITREQPLVPMSDPSPVVIYPLTVEGSDSKAKGLVLKITDDQLEVVSKMPLPREQLYGLSFMLNEKALRLIGRLVKITVGDEKRRNVSMRFDLVKANDNEREVIAAYVRKATS